MMKLYYTPGACSLSPHIAAREAGVPLELIKVDLKTHTVANGGQDFYAISPNGYVPVLELDDGTRLYEAAVLVQHLADQAPGSKLMPPAGTMERLQVQEWLNFIATEIHKTFTPLFAPEPPPDVTKKALFDKLKHRFAEVNRRLEGKIFLTGNTFTVADGYAYTIISWSGFVQLDLKPYPNLHAFMARVGARPKVQEALRAEGLNPYTA